MVVFFNGQPAPQQTKFKKDDRIIAVHDVDDFIKQGDTVFVEIPALPCCGGMKLQNHDQHYKQYDFELCPIREGEQLPENVQIGIPREKVLFMIQDFVETAFWNNEQGRLPINLLREKLQFHLNEMGLVEAYNERR